MPSRAPRGSTAAAIRLRTPAIRGAAVPALLAALLAAACADSPVQTPERPQFYRSATSQPSVVRGFDFLPPIAPAPTSTAPSDERQQSSIVICRLAAPDAGSECAEVVARLGTADVRFDATEGNYIGNWHTGTCAAGACPVGAGALYRARVLVGAAELGRFHARLLASARESSSTPAGVVSVVAGSTVPIRFRIAHGAVNVVEPGQPVSIGAGGGQIVASDGAAALEFPAGALGNETPITISEAEHTAGVPEWSTVVTLGPEGTTFAQPVKLTLAFDAARLPAGIAPQALAIYLWEDGGWVEVPGSVPAIDNGTVTVELAHFSTYTVLPRVNYVGGPGNMNVTAGYDFFAGWAGAWYRTPDGVLYPQSNVVLTFTTSSSAVLGLGASTAVTGENGWATMPQFMAVSPGSATVRAAVRNVWHQLAVSVQGTMQTPFCPGGPGVLSLQRAVLATLPNGTISVCNGTHPIDGVLIDRPLTLRSQNRGGATLATVDVAPALQGGRPGLWIERVPAGTVRIADIAFTTGGRAIYATTRYDRIEVDSVRFTGLNSNTIALTTFATDVPGATVDVRRVQTDGIFMPVFATGTAEVNVSNSRFERADRAIVLSGSPGLAQWASGTVSDNTFEGCGPGGCIRVLNPGPVAVERNTFTLGGATSHPVVVLQSSWAQPMIATVADNTFTGSRRTGNPEGPTGWTAVSAVDMNGFTNPADSVRVTGNTITGAYTAMRIQGGGRMVADNNTIGNGMFGLVQNAGHAVFRHNDVVTSGSLSATGIGTYTCNWWGSASGPALPGGSIAAGQLSPWAPQPIAGTSATACP
jgi:hypothetical protein